MALTPAELPAYLGRIRRRIADQGPTDAAYAMARRYHEHLTNDVLIRTSHAKGTQTPSGPGEPPAIVTGALRRSVRLYPAVKIQAYVATSHVQPHIVYARIQELGGTITAKNLRTETIIDKHGNVRRVIRGMLHWRDKGGDHFATSVTLPARPYMRPAHRETVADGSLRKAAIDAVKKLIY